MTFTRFVHIGDFHAAPGPRNADRYRALDQILDEVLGQDGLGPENLGGWLWPGDLFDALSTIEDRNALDRRLLRMSTAAPVFICYGNHDRAGDLDGFQCLRAKWGIYVFSTAQVFASILPNGRRLDLFVLPYPSKAGLVSAGVAPGEVVSTAGDVLEPIFIHAAAQLEAARARGALTMMIGHVNVAGSLASTGQPQIGHEIELHQRHLERLGPIYKGLNHIHRPQEIAGASYAGSVARMDYGETEAKRYLVVDIADDPELRPVITSKPIDVAPMFLIEGELSSDGFAPYDPELAARTDWSGCDVKVRWFYQASTRSVLDPSVIDRMYASALRLKDESVAIVDRDLRSPQVAKATTLAAKLAAYKRVDCLTETEVAKLALLEQADPDQVLAEVAASLKAIESPAVNATVAA